MLRTIFRLQHTISWITSCSRWIWAKQHFRCHECPL